MKGEEGDILEVPEIVQQSSHPGGVLDLKWRNIDGFVFLFTASSNGSATISKLSSFEALDHHSEEMSEPNFWRNLHSTATTGIDVITETYEMTTVGEDATINFLRINSPSKPFLSIANADSGYLNGVCYVSQQTVLTFGSSGNLKLWDHRTGGSQHSLASTFRDMESNNVYNSAAIHPHQLHVLALGSDDGTTSFWDLRYPNSPLERFAQHTANVWDIAFHPTAPNNLISCSEDGDVLLWNFATKGAFEPDAQSLTLQKLVHHDLAVNSFDINTETNMLICGTDSEAFFFTQPIL